ncbi:hypothetical protein [Phenylobacterium sp.]|jgi:hypothetical protein|uniref:hypothetical protein n=1 Tax=Phenylobacterium sp. TaxID=1871053 RepID=UPI002E2F66E3|nr:hypothetical protein [Phenylobacterium sp.]HEX4710477.1 hypothetical protein [Phenylobacterium sp.]
MKTSALGVAALSVGLSCASISATAEQDHNWHGGPQNRNWDAAHAYDGRSHHDRRMTRDDYVYRGSDGRYYCRRGDGTTGLVVGGVTGGLLGGAIGGDALGALLGAAGGAALGSSIDSGRVHCR